jgi:hypoxanthine phosphoribosyltransferase
MSEKQYLSAQQLLEDSFRLGAEIIKDGFRPTMMIAIWRGGVPMGIAIQELLAWYGIETDHIAIRTSSYTGIDGQSQEIRIHGMNYLVKNCRHQDRLLIVAQYAAGDSRRGALLQAVAQQDRTRAGLLSA